MVDISNGGGSWQYLRIKCRFSHLNQLFATNYGASFPCEICIMCYKVVIGMWGKDIRPAFASLFVSLINKLVCQPKMFSLKVEIEGHTCLHAKAR